MNITSQFLQCNKVALNQASKSKSEATNISGWSIRVFCIMIIIEYAHPYIQHTITEKGAEAGVVSVMAVKRRTVVSVSQARI